MLVSRVLELDFDEIERWFEAHDMTMPHKSLFPPTGFIVRGIAAGFIYFTDSPLAIIDDYISNPTSDLKTRSDALNMITEHLLEIAKRRGCAVVKCDSKIEVIKKRAEALGFTPVGSFDSFVMKI